MGVSSLDWGDPLEKEMATHTSTLAWRIPRTEEPGALQSIGSPRVRLTESACVPAKAEGMLEFIVPFSQLFHRLCFS